LVRILAVSMHIEEVEAIWAAIDREDDWSALYRKFRTFGLWARQWRQRLTGCRKDDGSCRSSSKDNDGSKRDLDEPATGATLWSGAIGDADAEVAAPARLGRLGFPPARRPHRDAAPLRQRRPRQERRLSRT
jgi:hypothetical protein